MKLSGLIRNIVVLASIAILLIPCVSAQTTLQPNQTLEDQFIFRREDPYSAYEPQFYEVTLDSDHWTVIVDILNADESLEVNITVASDVDMTDIIAVSGYGYGNYPQVDFDVESDDTLVYILVHENSVNGDTLGAFDIGVYDDEHLPLDTTTEVTDNPEVAFLGIGAVIIFVVIIAAIARTYFRSKEPKREPKMQVVQAPQRAIPQRYQSRTEFDDGLRMVRLPQECPKCSAPLSSESIDWVGPLEAKCSYCGATVRARFEKI
ncbi:hypothetical protein EU546_08250 [Candidatus Thorarchaeota archaeon]|nr:MAG: hypothetical protein EU546_08250 [Candidatus Thorarchaeota archaeon]